MPEAPVIKTDLLVTFVQSGVSLKLVQRLINNYRL